MKDLIRQGSRRLMAFLLMLVLVSGTVYAAPGSLTTNKGFSYYYKNGQMQKGWQEVDGQTKYFDENKGYMWSNGYGQIEGKQYYFDKEGNPLKGWNEVYGKSRYFDVKDGHLYKDRTANLGNFKYTFDKDGNVVKKENLASDLKVYNLKEAKHRYTNVVDAKAKKNKLDGFLAPGKYYIYKEYNGMLNLTKSQTGPGSWINPNERYQKPDTNRPNEIAEVIRYAVYNLNIRKGPGTNYETLGMLMKGEEIKGRLEGSWFKFSYKGQEAYVSNTYLSSQEINTNQEIKVVNNKILNVRAFKSTSAKKLGTLYEGQEIVGSVDGSWFRFDYKGQKAYVSKALLANKDHEVNGETRSVVRPLINIRAGKSVNADRLGSLKEGDQITGVEDGVWFRFSYKGSLAYVSKNLVKPLNNPNQPDIEKPEPESKDKFVIMLDPGHGQNENRGGLLFDEGNQTYEFSRLLINEAKKYKDIEIRTTREFIYNDPSLYDRSQAGRGADLYISIHTNAAGPGARGTEIWDGLYSQDREIQRKLVNLIASTLDTPNRGIKYRRHPDNPAKDYYAVLRDNPAKTKMLIEFVFHTNLQDSKVFLENQNLLARLMMQEIANHYGLK